MAPISIRRQPSVADECLYVGGRFHFITLWNRAFTYPSMSSIRRYCFTRPDEAYAKMYGKVQHQYKYIKGEILGNVALILDSFDYVGKENTIYGNYFSYANKNTFLFLLPNENQFNFNVVSKKGTNQTKMYSSEKHLLICSTNLLDN